MPKKKIPLRTLSIFLVKSGFTTTSDIFTKPGALDAFPLPKTANLNATLHVKRSFSSPPKWLAFFDGLFAGSQLGVFNASSSAVLLVPRGSRLYAIAFGYGRALLNPAAYEENFGLKVTLSSVDPEKIRSIELRSLEAISRSTIAQTSRETGIGDFGLDLERDLLRGVTGKPREETLGSRLAGKDSLAATARFDLNDLPNWLDRYDERFESSDYKKAFPWVDHIAEIKDPQTRAALDDRLIERIRTRNFDSIWLAAPELLDWSRVKGFRYRENSAADDHLDIHLDSFFSEVGDPAGFTIDKLRARTIRCNSLEGDQEIDHWPAYKCLNAELDHDGSSYLLSNASWFRIAGDFVEQVNAACNKVPVAAIELPNYDPSETEAQYNQRVAKADKDIALMDQKLIHIGGGPNKVEFCDLFRKRRSLLHVKRYSGSATLSHLFSQAVVSATAFMNDATFRKRINGYLPKGQKLANPQKRPEASKFDVVFAVISVSKKAAVELPFFSRISLVAAVQRLQGFGFRVSFGKIAVETWSDQDTA